MRQSWASPYPAGLSAPQDRLSRPSRRAARYWIATDPALPLRWHSGHGRIRSFAQRAFAHAPRPLDPRAAPAPETAAPARCGYLARPVDPHAFESAFLSE